MDELSEILKVLLKRMPYQLFLSKVLDCMQIEKNVLGKAVHSYMPFHSDTEVKYMLDSLGDFLGDYTRFLGNDYSEDAKAVSVFAAIFRFSDVMLMKRNNEVMFRYDRILRWRETTKDISEETFVTAFLARRDLKAGVYCKDFTWPFVIGHNNMQLRKITRKGMAENHFHLWGSSPYFHISWLKMMNHMSEVEYGKETKEMEASLRTSYIIYDKEYPERDIKCCCLQAALIRLFLYSVLTDVQIELGEYYIGWEYFLPWIRGIKGKIEADLFRQTAAETGCCRAFVILEKVAEGEIVNYLPVIRKILDKEIDFLKVKSTNKDIYFKDILYYAFQKQGRIKLKECRSFFSALEFSELWKDLTYQKTIFYLNNYEAMLRHIDQIQNAIDSIVTENYENKEDYALTSLQYNGYCECEINYILSGERRFLYEMFRRIDSADKRLPHHFYNLFYAYLIMKEKVRSEMVQSNNWVGFENFSIYQNRKDYFTKGEKMEKLKAKMSVISCQQQNVKYLEIRISPMDTDRENYQCISFLDKAIDAEGKMRDSFFYVLHFIKKQDDEIRNDEYCECRHARLRSKLEKKTIALLEFRRNFPDEAKRVLGIDAAAQEIGCRPEVFAQSFRTLQNDTCIVYSGGTFVKLPQLRATYHVGEDFLDIVDGLRAIDEAVLFLNLDCGDRIGHALALGISVKDWYRFKQNHISLSKQDYLDNIVWLYHAIIRYHIWGLDNLKNFIEGEYYKYFSEIYGRYMSEEYLRAIQSCCAKKHGYQNTVLRKNDQQRENMGDLVFDIHAYYDAWKIRGDAPELYKNGFFDKNSSYVAPFEVNAVNYNYPPDFEIRNKAEVAMIYHYYHYCTDVRLEGKKKIDVKISPEYRKGVELVQKAMQKEIAMRGIAIETNPSSNYMIGTFKRYDEHPIINFYNNGLTFDNVRLDECPQIWSSINTDDQGVFNIKLENEYALLARALEKKKNANGEHLYQKSMIYDWLDKIREMGLSQSFGNPVMLQGEIDNGASVYREGRVEQSKEFG